MTPFDELQREHEQLLDKAEVADVVAYIDRARAQAAQVGDPRERDQLRANLRYWASYVYDRNGTYPTTTLLPAAVAKSISVPPVPEPIVEEAVPAPRKIWPWLIGVAVVALMAVVALLSQFSLNRSAPLPPPSAQTTLPQPVSDSGSERLWTLPITTDLYDKPGSDPAAQVLGRMQTRSQFHATARTTDAQWLRITTAGDVSGWIKATTSGLTPDQLEQLPAAAIVIVSTPTSTSTPNPTSTPIATMIVAAGGLPSVTVPPPTPAILLPVTPTGPQPPSQAVPLQVGYRIVTFGPSPFNPDAWVIDVQLLATGGDNHYVFWVNGQRLDGERYTIDGVACRSASITIGATSNGQAVRRDVTLKSPLAKCK